MSLKKLFILIVGFSALPAVAENDLVYGEWTGQANYRNSYTPIYGEMPDPKMNTASMPLEGTRSVKLTISKDSCEIVFDFALDCIYEPDKKIIVIPEWRNEDSVYDSGLVITKLSSSSLELMNEYTRHSEEGRYSKYEMKGAELYLLTQAD